MTEGIRITRVFDAARDQVWDLWTRPELFAVWFGTDAVTVPVSSVRLDVRPGGSWSATMQLPDGGTIDWVGEVLEADAPAHLVMTITDDPAAPAREPVTVDLEATADGTTMTMTQTGGALDEDQYAQAEAGWQGFFDVMERMLAQRR